MHVNSEALKLYPYEQAMLAQLNAENYTSLVDIFDESIRNYPDRVAYTALGQDLTEMNEDALARFRRDHMGVVFQSFHLIPTMTALENVATPLELAGRKDAFEAAAAELEAVGLAQRADHYPAQLSGGEQQRVALARAAAPRPAILLADEPTGNLDSANGSAIMEMLFGLRDTHGATLVLVTHAPELAARCDRVVELRDGRLDGDAAARAAE